MKDLLFLIAEKIATDNNPNTIFICASILKDEFVNMGYSLVNSNTMAIDTLKIVMKTMINFKA
jgi:hypothetical protein